ncbi:sodium-dependent lysophosphatidylcholine symporter 1-A-like isoform X2 [Oncorhynchus nerka]|uniref:sodium-dependent lysophosphatidylcholine symporter 1-A-like isoform X2 n=1 Tax=Oncorhynchus nerka TaxID=8023 RepID=UPI0031B8A2B5
MHFKDVFLTSVLVNGGLFFLCCLVLFLGVKELRNIFGELCTVLYPCSWAWVPAPSVSADCSNYSCFTVTAISGTGLEIDYNLHWSMLPDVVDDFAVKNNLLQGPEATFFLLLRLLQAGLLPSVPHQRGTTPPAPERARQRG